MLDGKVAIVTGAAGGIGKASSAALLELGCHVVLLDRNEAVHRVAEDFASKRKVSPYVVDLLSVRDIRETGMKVSADLGRIDILVNNAGVHTKPTDGRQYSLEELPLEVFQETLAINLLAGFLLYQVAFPFMKKAKWGRIINVSSRAGRTMSRSAGAHYAASKGGLIALNRVMALESAPYNVTANCIAPGPIETGMTVKSDDQRKQRARDVPLARYGQPEEIAAVVKFLASDASSFMTGAVLDVNGGMFMPS